MGFSGKFFEVEGPQRAQIVLDFSSRDVQHYLNSLVVLGCADKLYKIFDTALLNLS